VTDLSPDTILSRYRIIQKIGAGGMGDVYHAQDTELGRSVALKFLTGEVSSREAKLKRFIQEAKAASALNHPNIVTVYEIGREDDHIFLATELVEGLTLRHHMRAGLKLLEVLDIAIQIASALVAAHSAGIVHRDIKPENIMVRTDGLVKVLDFGLAKLTEKYESSGSEATTIALVNTEPGSIMGTVTYMSPEQAAGREVDTRTDIWSLGVVLYEMLAGRPPFEGTSKSHIVVAIADRDPTPISQLVADVPEALEWIIAEALTKDREERCQTAKELLGKLKRLKQRIESGTLPTSPSDLDRSVSSFNTAKEATLNDSLRQTAPDQLATQVSTKVEPKHRSFLILLSVIGFGLYKLLTPSRPVGPIKMSALTTGGKINNEDISGQLTISPDGKYVVCAANDSRQRASLWLRQISTNTLIRLVTPDNGVFVATTFSPDSELVYYVAILQRDNFLPTLYRVPVIGGTPTKVLDQVLSPIGFSPDGRQFAFVRGDTEAGVLMIANTDGSGAPRFIARIKQPNLLSNSGPSWSPDGKRVAIGMFHAIGAGYSTVVEVPVEGGEPKNVGSERWASVGRVVWLNDGSGLIMTAQTEFSSVGTQIWFVPYPSGPARRITNDLNGYGEVSLGVTSDATTIATIQQINSSSIWIGRPGDDETKARQILKTNLPESVSWTPDGNIVYTSRTGENWDIWTSKSDGSEVRQLTADAYIDQQPSVCGDGRHVVFQSNRSRNRNIWRINIDGTEPKQLTSGDQLDAYPVCSPDGQSVVFMSSRSGHWTIWRVGIDGGDPVQLSAYSAELPIISPDGKTVGYYVRDVIKDIPKMLSVPLAGGDRGWLLDLPRSVQPIVFAWTPDGKSIAYLDNATGILNVWSQPIKGGTPTQLTNFKTEFVSSFAISRDNKIATYRWSAVRDIVLIKDFR
jgi:serine/threonine protein kinase